MENDHTIKNNHREYQFQIQFHDSIALLHVATANFHSQLLKFILIKFLKLSLLV